VNVVDESRIAEPHIHYGNPKGSTRHFIIQRLTGALNILFLIFFVWLVVRLAGSGRTEMVGVVGNPIIAIIIALLIANVATHMRIGMREVIEDYVQDPRLHSLCLSLNTFFALAVTVLAWIALAKIVFWG